jgi:hypothetical protein
MKKVKLFEEYMMSDMVQEIHRLHDGELNEEQKTRKKAHT